MICDIHSLNYSNPIFYTNKFLQNVYVKANHLAKHIHLFNNQISYIDYSFFYNLNDAIISISEAVVEKIYDGKTYSESFENQTLKYYFNKDLELYLVEKHEKSHKEVLSFSKSLKQPERLQILKYFDGITSSQIDITFSEFLEFEKIDEETFYNNKTTNWVKPNQKSTKYSFKENGKIYKTIFRNNAYEQSKTLIIFDDNFLPIEYKAYDQKDKYEILYEVIFIYDDEKLKSINYIQYKSTKIKLGNRTEHLSFEYNKKGLLEILQNKWTTKRWTYDENDNPVSIKEFNDKGVCITEIKSNYKYDKHNNWILKKETTYINNILKKETQISREIEYR